MKTKKRLKRIEKSLACIENRLLAMDRSNYPVHQHKLICEALEVSPEVDGPGDTALEAVLDLQGRLEDVRKRIGS